MIVYKIGESFIRRRYLRGGYAPVEHKKCASCGANHPVPDTHRKYVEIHQGSFVSNILWDWGHFHVTEELKKAFQKEGFETVEFEPTEIVKDDRPSGDRKKLPLEQISQFYRVKLRSSIPLHQDFIQLYDLKYCPECDRNITKNLEPSVILDRKCHPGTDFFRVERYGALNCCTERGKTFLENHPKTYCSFRQYELRD